MYLIIMITITITTTNLMVPYNNYGLILIHQFFVILISIKLIWSSTTQ